MTPSPSQMARELKPCPFCGSIEVFVADSPVGIAIPNVACFDCGARGPAARRALGTIPGEKLAKEAALLWNSRPAQESKDGYAPCPTCRQYSHSIGEDRIAEAYNHFQSMFSHRGDGIPTQYAFDEKTRDAAEVLIAAARNRS